MAVEWSDVLLNHERLTEFYDAVPDLAGVTIRSVYLDRRGLTLALRLDLPAFADTPLAEWAENRCDRVQCQLKFLALDEVMTRDLRFPAVASVVITRRENRRIAVCVTGCAGELRFTSSDSVTVRKVSAFRSSEGQMVSSSSLASWTGDCSETTCPRPMRRASMDEDGWLAGVGSVPYDLSDFLDASTTLLGRALFSVHIDERDSRVVLGFEFDGLPAHPRPQCVEQGLNAFEMYLTFLHVRNLVLDGWTGGEEHTLHFEWLGAEDDEVACSAVQMDIRGAGELLRFTAGSVKLTNVRAYRASRIV